MISVSVICQLVRVFSYYLIGIGKQELEVMTGSLDILGAWLVCALLVDLASFGVVVGANFLMPRRQAKEERDLKLETICDNQKKILSNLEKISNNYKV